MTTQLSRERLEEIALEIGDAPQFIETLEMARMLLAGMDSEPVYQMRLLDGTPEETIWVEASKDEFNTPLKNPSEWERRTLYAAPPAPVAVPDEWRSVLQEMVNAMLAYEMDVGEPAPYKHRRMMMRAGHLLESHRAAMQTEPVTAATVPEEKGSSLQLRNLIRRRHAKWSQITFGNVGPVGPLKHLAKEAIEAAEAPDDLSEWADMQFLLWDAQRRAGISDAEITVAMEEKLKVNMARQWPEPKDGEPRLHIKAAPEQEV